MNEYMNEDSGFKLRFYMRENLSEIKLCTPEAVFEELKEIGKADQESLWIVMLNVKNAMIKKEMLFLGAIDNTHVDIKIIFRRLLQHGAAKFVICHNHPSGVCEPSMDDVRLTSTLKDVAKLVDISLIDHVIIGEKTYFSFREKGLI